MTDPFAGRSEIGAEEWIAVVGRTEDALYVATRPVVAQDERLTEDTSPTSSHKEKRATATTEPKGRMRESAFRDAVVALARYRGWLVYWTWNSTHSPAGFPDIVAARRGRVVAAELKVGGNTPTAAQEAWLAELAENAGIEAFVWYPEDWDAIEEVLS
jgi:hypothetical protein